MHVLEREGNILETVLHSLQVCNRQDEMQSSTWMAVAQTDTAFATQMKATSSSVVH